MAEVGTRAQSRAATIEDTQDLPRMPVTRAAPRVVVKGDLEVELGAESLDVVQRFGPGFGNDGFNP